MSLQHSWGEVSREQRMEPRQQNKQNNELKRFRQKMFAGDGDILLGFGFYFIFSRQGLSV